jgi:hypothetical protein
MKFRNRIQQAQLNKIANALMDVLLTDDADKFANEFNTLMVRDVDYRSVLLEILRKLDLEEN